MTELNKVVKAIKKYNRFLITSHINLEGDSLGSQLAVANLLASLGKSFVVLDNDEVPERYHFLPHAGLVKNEIKNEKFDAAIVLDCPNLKRTGKVKSTVEKVDYIINIDHHVSNEMFGDINWVEKNTSSVGEMIYTLHKKFNCKISKETALYLYIAILTDTGSFNYSNTSSITHEIVSELLGYGIEPYKVSHNIYENKTSGEIKLLGEALSTLRITEGGKAAYMVVRKNLFKKTNTKPTACEAFVNYARSIKGVKVAAFFREDIKKRNFFHISFRSTGKADVNKIASYFGGGGHMSASGCKLKGNFESVKKKVLKRIKDEL